jgi:hypothetical protein
MSTSTSTRASAGEPAAAHQAPRQAPRDRFTRMWRSGAIRSHTGPVHVSMNDYLVEGPRDALRVALAGMRFWLHWPRTEGALGCWFAGARAGQRSVSVSVWRDPADLRRFVRSPAHLAVMRDFRETGELHTNAWTAERFDRALIWRQAEDRLNGRVDGVRHH